MRFTSAALLALAMAASPAAARTPTVIEFNGYSLTIHFQAFFTPVSFDDADARAAEVCASVGKTASRELERNIRDLEFTAFYICL